jgi:uncharacterized repeat protein (TIGR01451 family)
MRRSLCCLLSAVGVVGAGLCLSSNASAQVLRFETTQPGNVIATGNTLGLAKQASANGPGLADAIGTFLTLDTTSVDDTPANPGNPWPAGTTSAWQENGSAATLTIPVEATVLYAELVWGGSFAYGAEDVTANLNDSVVLRFGADEATVAPATLTAVTENFQSMSGFQVRYYMRSADVTDFVEQHKSGSYATLGVPGTQDTAINSTSAAGWTLIVAYRYDGDPIRNMGVFVGGKFVDEFTTLDYTVDGFCAPPSTPFEGTIAISTIEGDANRDGDFISIGESAGDPTFVTLSGPNNPADNFFCSQLNGPDGQLDTTGTFGDANHDAQAGANVSGGRQGWDVTHVALSSEDDHLVPNQTVAVLRTETLDDSYMPVLAGIAIEVNAPKFGYDQSTTVVDKDTVTLGDTFTVTVKAVNDGFAPAENVRFTLPLQSGLTLADFSTDGSTGDINGSTVSVPTNVDMGDIAPGATRTVDVTIEVSQPQPNDIIVAPVWDYDYVMCSGDAPIVESFKAQVKGVDYVDEPTSGDGGAGGGQSSGGADGGTGGDGGGDDGGFGALPQGGGLCTCTLPQSSSDTSPAWALALAALFGLRRKSSKR